MEEGWGDEEEERKGKKNATEEAVRPGINMNKTEKVGDY